MHIINFLKKRILLVFILAGCLIQGLTLIYTGINHKIIYSADSVEYLNAANNLLKNNILYCGDLSEPERPALYSHRTPLYPMFLFFIKYIYDSNLLIILFQIALYLLNIYILWLVLQYLNISNIIKVFTLCTFVLYLPEFIYTQIIMSEIIFQTLLLLSLFFICKYFYETRTIFLLYFNIVLSLALLTKPILFYFWIPNIFFHFWIFSRHRKREILIYPFILLLTIAVWSSRNYQKTHYFHFSSIKNFNLLYFNTYLFIMNESGEDSAQAFLSNVHQKIEKMDYATANAYIERACIKKLTDHILGYTVFHLRGMVIFFIDPGRFDICHFLNIPERMGFLYFFKKHGMEGINMLLNRMPISVILYLILMTFFNMILLISLLKYLITPSENRGIKIYIIMIIGYLVLLTGPLGNSRFKLPVFPFLLYTLPFFLTYLKQKNIPLIKKLS